MHDVPVPTPLPSATVVLARQRAGVAEILLARRRAGSSFGASYVFPGGVLESQDRNVAGLWRPGAAARADRCLGVTNGLDYYSAAIRELFEETGVLLARDGTGAMPESTPAGEKAREDLLAARLSWPAFLEASGLVPADDALTCFAWWITPAARPRRFSTLFFLAALPAEQTARHDGHELTDSQWMTAERAAAAGRRGDMRIPPPTMATLRDLAALRGLEDLRAWARQREAVGVRPILPVIVATAAGEKILMPGEPGYAAHAQGDRP